MAAFLNTLEGEGDLSHPEEEKKPKHLPIQSVYLNFHSAKCHYSAVQPSKSEPHSAPNRPPRPRSEAAGAQAAFCSPNNYTLICNVK